MSFGVEFDIPTELLTCSQWVKTEVEVQAAAQVQAPASTSVVTKYYYHDGQRVAMRRGSTV